MAEITTLAEIGGNGKDGKTNSDREISDERFIGQLDQLRQLKQFLFEEKVQFKAEDLNSIDFGGLNNLRYAESGRVPGVAEWHLLDEKLSALAAYLGDDLRRKIRIRELAIFFRILPLIFLITSIVSTIAYMMLGTIFEDNKGPLYPFVWLTTAITWATSQGGLGACAFLGTSVILKSSQDTILSDPKNREVVDITDRNFLVIRVILGTLFAVLLGLPFVSRSLNGIYASISSGFNDPSGTATVSSNSTLIYILIPFIVGFSTNLVLVILSRSVIAIETFFGLSGRT